MAPHSKFQRAAMRLPTFECAADRRFGFQGPCAPATAKGAAAARPATDPKRRMAPHSKFDLHPPILRFL
ncbi:hypothetical protein BH23VER1_BH23VER1_21430 [soil metagenome]